MKKIVSQFLMILSLVLVLAGSYFLLETIDLKDTIKAATQTNYSENWTASSGLYSSGYPNPNIYKSGFPAEGESLAFCGKTPIKQKFISATGWDVSGNIGNTGFSESWKATNGFFSQGFHNIICSPVNMFYECGDLGVYLKGIPENNFCDVDSAGFFTPSQWSVSGVIQPEAPVAYYTETWDVKNGIYESGGRAYTGLPEVGTSCAMCASGFYTPTSWSVTGTISDVPLSLSKHYFVTQAPFLLTDGRYGVLGILHSSHKYNWLLLRLQAKPAYDFCNADPQVRSGKTYRAVFTNAIAPAGTYLDGQHGSGQVGGAVNYSTTSPYFYWFNSSGGTYATCSSNSQSLYVTGRYFGQGKTLGSIDASNLYTYDGPYGSCSVYYGTYDKDLVKTINEQNLRLLCVEE